MVLGGCARPYIGEEAPEATRVRLRGLNGLMAAEFDHHLAQDRAAEEGKNHRNGSTSERVLTDDSHVEVTIPRDGKRASIEC